MAKDEAYYQAEKKIEEALKSNPATLILSGMRLTEVSESLDKLK